VISGAGEGAWPLAVSSQEFATGCPILGMAAARAWIADSRELLELSLIALKNMQNLRICYASMLLDFRGSAVLRCRGVLKSAES
jgi:hypothetical protein